MRRHRFTCGIAAAIASPAAISARAAASSGEPEIAALERRYGGRLGVYAIDLGSGRRIAHRADEAFPMCSTFKLLAVAAVLCRAEQRREDMRRIVTYSSRDLLHYAPVTKAHVGRGGVGRMTVEALCAAAIEWSDNTAANLLLATIGGPGGVTAYARSIGDRRTRLDRTEPSLNDAVAGDPRDTTTPASMAADVRALTFGAALGTQHQRLRTWMLGCRTSADRIPAGLPRTWRSGNKTGSGDNATANDVAFVLPPAGAPKIVAAYFTGSRANEDEQNATLAAVGRIVARRFASFP